MRLVRGGWGAWGLVLALAGACSGKDGASSSPGGGPQAGQQGQGAKPIPVQVMKVEPGPVRDTREYVGTLISRRSITVFPQVAGYVKSIPVRPGNPVKAGQVLLVVDPRDRKSVV